MSHPLSEYRKLWDISFIKQTEYLFYVEYHDYINGIPCCLSVLDKDNESLIITSPEGAGESTSSFSIYDYFRQNYSKLEKDTQGKLEADMVGIDEKQRETNLKFIISELQLLLETISNFSLEGTNEKIKTILMEKVGLFAERLAAIYLNTTVIAIEHKPKMQWLGYTNLLATLFYDLLEGQQKHGEKKSKILLKAKDKDIADLIANNFLDKDGKNIKPNTILEYLNEFNVLKRSSNGVRIELERYE